MASAEDAALRHEAVELKMALRTLRLRDGMIYLLGRAPPSHA
jgi:hypothetical protein